MNYPQIPETSVLTDSAAPPLVHDILLPTALTCPALPVTGSKSIFAFWHSGIGTLPPYLLRSVLAWYRRYSPLGWSVHIIDNVPGSPLNASHYIDTSSPDVVPAAFTTRSINGTYALQHTSDLIRYPLLLKYGGVYLDVGILQFGDLNWLWEEVISNPASPYDYAGFTTMSASPDMSISNFSLMCGPANPLVLRAHKILLELWEGKTNTVGMHSHPILEGVPLLRVPAETVVNDGDQAKMVIDDAAMTDYAIQMQAMGAAQRWLDMDDGWDGPKYVREKAWLLSMLDGASIPMQLTGWNGQRQFDLLSLNMPQSGEKETEDQMLARELVEKAVGGSWCLKLSHGFAANLFGGDTLGMLWKKHEGSDCAYGTYAGWMRWAETSCKQNKPMKPMQVPVYEPAIIGKLKDQL